jgi:hypothetical protein
LHGGQIARVRRGFGQSRRVGVVGVMLGAHRHATSQ